MPIADHQGSSPGHEPQLPGLRHLHQPLQRQAVLRGGGRGRAERHRLPHHHGRVRRGGQRVGVGTGLAHFRSEVNTYVENNSDFLLYTI